MDQRSTLIAWTDETLNFWMGCVKVSAGCKFCYAETLTKNRMGRDVWGKDKPRPQVKAVRQKLANVAKRDVGVLGFGKPKLAFVGSLMDWAEDHPQAEINRPMIWDAVRRHPRVHFQMLTKRPERIASLLPGDWGSGYDNVWLGTSIENMDVAWRADELRKIPARVRFISYEPAIGPLDELSLYGIHWVIYGGESGNKRRPEGTPEDPKCWARTMRDKCKEAGVAYFHKQSSHRFTERGIELDGEVIREFPL